MSDNSNAKVEECLAATLRQYLFYYAIGRWGWRKERGEGANKKEIVAPGEGWPEGEGCRNVVVNAPRFLSPLFRDGWKSHRVRGKRVTCLSLFSFDYYYLLSQRNCPST